MRTDINIGTGLDCDKGAVYLVDNVVDLLAVYADNELLS